VLVFFENAAKLNEFYNSQAFENQKASTFTLSELDSDEDKITRIKFATIAGTVTLFTNSFGRGTDFICAD